MITAIIQARMGSTRLPGKVLKEIDGISLLEYQIKRVNKSQLLDKIIVATTIARQDDAIVTLCEKNKIEYFRGSEIDCLARYYQCAKKYNADVIVRLTADCPLSDPHIVDNTINLYINTKADYVANTIPPETSKYPDGTDVEVFSIQALEQAFHEAKNPQDREHVTFYFWKYNNFKTRQLDNGKDYSKYRLTVDYPEDFEVVKFIVGRLKEKNIFGYLHEIIDILDSNPEIRSKNSQYHFGVGWNK